MATPDVREIFRKRSLERLSSPERLDQLMRVTTPVGWAALAMAAIILVTAVLWGFFGSIPIKVQGTGILIRQGGVFEVVSFGEGLVSDFKANVGDIIESGHKIATVAQPELATQLDAAQRKLANLEEEKARINPEQREDFRLQIEYLNTQKTNLDRSIAELEKQLGWQMEQVRDQTTLLKEGLVTKSTLADSQTKVAQTQLQIAQNRNELKNNAARIEELRRQFDEQRFQKDQEIRDVQDDIAELQTKSERVTEIVSPFRGRVLEVDAGNGKLISAGNKVLTLEVLERDLTALAFIPAATGKKAQPGMPAEVSPTIVKRSEFGYIRGVVRSVSEFPASANSMLQILNDSDLVNALSAQGPPLLVNASLEKDPQTKSGFRWSSSRGPDIAITSGTLIQCSVIVEEQRPITLLIPFLRNLVGVD